MLDEDRALVLEAFDHVFIVHDLMTHIDRRAVLLERALDDLDRAHDARAKPAGLRQIHFHGMPVTQVAPNSFLYLRPAGASAISAPCPFRIRPLPRRMEAQGFVSKNGRLEKAGRNDRPTAQTLDR
jgi:hypothetical protein